MLSPHRLWRLLFVFGAGMVLFVAGCDGGVRSSVEGKVSYNGESVDQGGIAFVPADEGSALLKATGPINAGRYKLDNQRGPEPGKYRVEITWRKKTGKKVPGEGGHPRDEVVPGIPAKYNTETVLVVDVKHGVNKFDFDVKE